MQDIAGTAAPTDHFDREGWLHLPRRASPDLVARLSESVDALCREAAAAEAAGRPFPGVSARHDGAEPVPVRINDPIGHDPLCTLLRGQAARPLFEWLGSAGLLEVATALCGTDAVPTQIDLLIKTAGEPDAIQWHQDVVFDRNSRWIAAGLYLDDVADVDGGLRVVPGSQTAPQDICALEAAHGRHFPGTVALRPLAGDVLVHDTMVLHASDALRSSPRRRTLYVYFQSEAVIAAAEPENADWAAARRRLLDRARAVAAGNDDPALLGPVGPADLRRIPRRGHAANYCVRHGGRVLGTSWALSA